MYIPFSAGTSPNFLYFFCDRLTQRVTMLDLGCLRGLQSLEISGSGSIIKIELCSYQGCEVFDLLPRKIGGLRVN